ncbi:MAG: class I SAM-dependent methyltransferase [Planctomycetota bacterium]
MVQPLTLAEIERLYDEAYYTGDCDGHAEFRRGHGARLPRRLKKCAKMAAVTGRDRVVDVGCGRGELALDSARRGATVVAIDPARSALRIVRTQLNDDVAARLVAVRARGEALPVPTSWATVIFLTDVVEHLPPAELAETFQECRRALAPDGRLIVHTQPNRLLVDWTVPVLSRLSWSWGVRLPRDLRTEMTPGSRKPYHVNEQSLEQLRKSLLRHGFTVADAWLEGSYPIHRIFGDGRLKDWFLPHFRRRPLLKKFFASQLFAHCRPAGNLSQP